MIRNHATTVRPPFRPAPRVPAAGWMATRRGPGRLVAAGTVLVAAIAAPTGAQSLPFGPGEKLVYEAHVAPMGRVGKGTLSIQKAQAVRGHRVYLLSFDFSVKVGPLEAVQKSDSWLDPVRFTVLRFHKQEKKPLARDNSERVEIYPEQGRWAAADGKTGRSPTSAPLDELSLLYYVRLLRLEPGQEIRLERHFDPARNPVIVKALRREAVEVPAGTFDAMVIEMRVRDPERYPGEGRILMHIVEDDRRTPVRIETALPDAGTITLELDTVRLVGPEAAARVVGRGRK